MKMKAYCRMICYTENSAFWPWNTVKGPKRSFVVALLRVGGESWAKNVPNQTKIVQGKKKCASVAHYGIELPCLPCMVLCGLAWPYVALYGLDVAFQGHDYVWPH